MSWSTIGTFGVLAFVAAVTLNLVYQLLFRFLNKTRPPLVFHWIPFLGSTIRYGTDPYKFFFSCRQKHGDIFTFVLLGRPTTVYLGIKGNEFILNGKLKDVNAEEVYGPLTTPVFGPDVVYDCPNSKLIEQKKFIKYGLTQAALESHVPLIEKEVMDYLDSSPNFLGASGEVDISAVMAEITIFTAGSALQGEEVRSKLNAEFAVLCHDLDKGFSPINFMLPWAPLPHNKKRDAAHTLMHAIYLDIIEKRRRAARNANGSQTQDMIENLMQCTYKNGQRLPDKEIANIMISLLMAGQHSSSTTSSWIMLHLASEPAVVEQLYQEQLDNLPRTGPNGSLGPLQYGDLDRLPLHRNVIKETLRLHTSIHSLLRKVMNPMPVAGTPYVIPPSHVVLSAPGVTALSDEYFPNPTMWDPNRWETQEPKVDEKEDMVDYGYGVISKGTSSPYLPFGAGRHRCIGEKFAYVNLTVIVAIMVRHLQFSNIGGKTGVPRTDYSSMFSEPMKPARINWKRRTAKSG
ncbi:cytochrome P450 sterol 14 alpha-demethylase [Histoplasma capsulatum G186AR]|uniref:sterol 14alpha-demethylase n=2 Tax=Ajellomyces capsulatus TaxID=5037 RepID=C0NBA9_AJECG|nr:cytochrome P450 sterol 14 alpha-demethylase [Histoplasma capsulatum G186AR]EEH10950.1 cytochrome P450 sterol 14 alpha-demethylase [Histoplasma capsulatum G186AR]KAG5288819.1 cytochrome P450 sterol 14 alpha-demethylase [Histoplasma capsulatum]QSS71396.1 cytochrome P450 sterol 14 alpha-demethylase [Histoplasma capsulatum G186AR]